MTLETVQFLLIGILALSQIASWVALLRTRETLDALAEMLAEKQEADATALTLDDLNNRLANLQTSRFSYMGSTPRRKS